MELTSKLPRQSILPITLLSLVFFIWGLLTSLNSMLVPFLKEAFVLSYVESMYIQLAFYIAPFLVCLPTAFAMGKMGYVRVIQLSLGLLTLGCFLFIPASSLFSYPLFLLAIFVLASGIAALQVAANPFAVSLGPVDTAASRLTFCSSVNSVGTTLASALGMGVLMAALVQGAEQAVGAVQLPYMIMGSGALLLAVLLRMLPKQAVGKSAIAASRWQDLLSYRAFVFGAVAIFCYVGVEVAVGTFLISYLTDGEILSLSPSKAGVFVSLYWGGALLGRLLGSFALKKVEPRKVLIVNAIVAILLVVVAVATPGLVGAWCLTLVGLCNSIMYPVIFSTAVKNLGALAGRASAILIMCGVGGALLPLAQALLADSFGLTQSFFVPALGYLVILLFATQVKNH
ncbi:glucose/galactose MFS transporter (plasmid) [Photobacterium sp. DA100]|uniref:glucose/galactose MFS transporter n=1 Tax=Photobacterium sp. DA100 TaxID=3027472 RepID=UPI00247A2267|nr:glucose/galactose MFS transporter [Photobacterium sp. DA100]WEM44677.1 glucose/galactose MFS transporter [Photobacterium sp. DA100]